MTETATPLADALDPAPTPPVSEGAADPQSSGETDRLDPESKELSLKNGMPVQVLPLKMRQLFRLLRIVTRGGAQYLPLLRDALSGMNGDDDNVADAFGAQLVAVMIIALPEAEEEAVDFMLSVVEPVGLRTGRDKATKAYNEDLNTQLQEALFNPDLDDMISIIEKVIAVEKDDLIALGKRLGQTFRLAEKIDPQTQAASRNLQDSV